MTTIDKLAIRGIRSYGSHEETVIKFFKPLTIILGRNGSGKSTIIEAVKMATTGDLPPLVDKGAAFIHDPRIHNETETKAMIRLLFTNVRGDQYIVARHFQLTLKRLPRSVAGYKPEFKSLDHRLKKTDNQNPKASTVGAYRQNDLNTILPDVMRVSKPVLNNVIFVHQEDSLWPLSDSKRLKEKFDEIFAATRYTRALDIIRKYRKDQTGEVKTVNVELMHFEDKVKRLEAVRNEVDEIQVRHDELNRGVKELENDIAALRQDATSATNLERQYRDLTSDLEKLRVKGSLLEKEKAEKYADLQVHLSEVDDDHIRHQIEQLQTSLDNAEEECARKSRLIDELTADIDMKRAESTQRQTRKGMLEQQAKIQRDRLDKLDRMKNEVLASRDLKEQLNTASQRIRLPNSSDTMERWSEALDHLRRDADDYVRKLTEDGNNTLDAASANCTNVKVRLEAAKTELARKRSSIDESSEKLGKVRSELRELEQSQVSIKDAEGRMKALQTALLDKQQSGQIASLEEKISDQKKKISSAKEDLSAARRTRDFLLQDQAEQAKLEVARRGLKSTEIQLISAMEDLVELQISAVRDLAELDVDSSTLDAIRSQISSVGSITAANAADKQPELDEISTKILAKRDLLIEKAEREHADGKATLKSAESQKAESEQTWTSLGSEVRRTKLEIHKVLKKAQELPRPPEDLQTLLSGAVDTIVSPADSQSFGNEWFFDTKKSQDSLQSAISKAKQKVSQQETGLMLAIGDLEQFEEHPKHMCPACGVVSSKKVDAMRSNLQNRIEIYRDPERLTVAKRRLEALEKALEEVKRLGTLTDTASDLNSKLTNASVERNDSSRKFETAKTTQSRAETALSKAKQLSAGGNTQEVFVKRLELNQLTQTFRRAQQDLDMLQTSLSISREDERSLADVDGQVRQLEEDLTDMQETLDRTQKSLESEKDDLRRVEVRFHQAKQICLEQEAKSERHKSLVSEKENLNLSMRNLEEQIEMDRSTCSRLKAELREAEEDFQRTRGENATLVNHASAKLSKRRAASQAWAECQREIDAYKRSGKDKELQTLIQSLEAITAEVSSKTADLRKHEREQRTASDSRKDVEGNLRNLRDNQKYRLLEQELKANARSMRHIEDKLGTLEQTAGELPSAKVKRLTEQINMKNAERHATMGKRQVYTERYKEKRKEFAEAESEGSRRKFDECRIKKQTMQLASGDLDRYHRALDQALMAFHTLKMNSINRTIKELWQQTYRGTDIEEIEITSDHGDGKGGAIKRNFNYRVQMRQGGAVLDMRGRCSAGQKVLACLVIRLALAESFCSDCGILALDEPTTNLDRENIQSLAAALKTIIELRRKQRNFQLVLITHDQEFIEMLGAREICNEYYTVYKDGSGMSKARLQDLRTIL